MKNDEAFNRSAYEILQKASKIKNIPSNVTVSKNSDESITLSLKISDKQIGSINIEFTPSIENIKGFLLLNSVDPLAAKLNHSIAYSFADLFLRNFLEEMQEIFFDLDQIPRLIMRLSLSEQPNNIPIVPDKKLLDYHQKTRNDLDSFCEERKRRIKRRVLRELLAEDKSTYPEKHLIGYYYDIKLAEWEKAKDCYKKNKSFKNWEKMIEVSFEDLPIDLIKRLGDSDRYSAMPSSIALENAARLCGFRNNSIGLRGLQKHLQQSREWMAKVGNDCVKDEAEKYFEKVCLEVRSEFEMAKLEGKNDVQFNTSSLLHQEIARKCGNYIKVYLSRKPGIRTTASGRKKLRKINNER